MAQNLEEIISDTLALPPVTRAILAERLMNSLDAPDRKETLLTLTLDPELEQRLQREASCQGLSPQQYAVQALEEHVSQADRERREKAVALVQSWIDEGDEEEQKETGEYLIRVLDEDRLSDRKLFPDELKGVSW
jgi:predicted transcriptional regulator